MLMINPDRRPPDDWDPDNNPSGKKKLPFFAIPLVACAVTFDLYITWVDREICFWGTLSAGMILLATTLVKLLVQHQKR